MSGAAERRLALALAVLARWTGAVDGAAVVAAAIIIDDWISGGAAPSPVGAVEPVAVDLDPVEPEPVVAEPVSAEPEPVEPEPVATEPVAAEPETVAAEPPALDGVALSVYQAFHAAVVAAASPPYNRELVEQFGVSQALIVKTVGELRKAGKVQVESVGPRRRVAVEIDGAWKWSPWSDFVEKNAPAPAVAPVEVAPPVRPAAEKKEFLSLNDAADAAAAFLRTRDFVVAASPEGWLVDGRRHDSLGLLAVANRHLRQMGRPIYVVRGGNVAA